MKCPNCDYTGISQLEIDLYECQMCGERFTEAEAAEEVIPTPSFIERIILWFKKIIKKLFCGKGVR